MNDLLPDLGISESEDDLCVNPFIFASTYGGSLASRGTGNKGRFSLKGFSYLVDALVSTVFDRFLKSGTGGGFSFGGLLLEMITKSLNSHSLGIFGMVLSSPFLNRGLGT